MSILKITADNFEEAVLKSDKPVVLDFWAPWCGPCGMFAPVFEECAETENGFTFGKVNIDESREIAAKFRVMSIPTVVIVKNGEVAAKKIGALSAVELKELLNGNK